MGLGGVQKTRKKTEIMPLLLTSPRSDLSRGYNIYDRNVNGLNIYNTTWASYLCKLVTYNMTCTFVCLFVCLFGFAVLNISWCILGVPEDSNNCRVGFLWETWAPPNHPETVSENSAVLQIRLWSTADPPPPPAGPAPSPFPRKSLTSL